MQLLFMDFLKNFSDIHFIKSFAFNNVKYKYVKVELTSYILVDNFTTTLVILVECKYIHGIPWYIEKYHGIFFLKNLFTIDVKI